MVISVLKQSGSRLYTGLAEEAPAAADAAERALPLPVLARESKNSTARSLISVGTIEIDSIGKGIIDFSIKLKANTL